jgi:pyruvate-formate lyase-activating enzyme
VIWAEYAIDTAKACRQLGIKTVAVTAGYITPEARPEFYSVMDAANVDLKAFTEVFLQEADSFSSGTGARYAQSGSSTKARSGLKSQIW